MRANTIISIEDKSTVNSSLFSGFNTRLPSLLQGNREGNLVLKPENNESTVDLSSIDIIVFARIEHHVERTNRTARRITLNALRPSHVVTEMVVRRARKQLTKVFTLGRKTAESCESADGEQVCERKLE